MHKSAQTVAPLGHPRNDSMMGRRYSEDLETGSYPAGHHSGSRHFRALARTQTIPSAEFTTLSDWTGWP